MSSITLAAAALASRRLYNQGIAQSRFTSALEVVSWLGAVQAQDYPAAKWAVGLRLPGSSLAAGEAAVARREIVRTWALRGTLHLLAAAELRWLLGLVGPGMVARQASYHRRQGLDTDTFDRSDRLMQAALQGGNSLTRMEMAAAMNDGGVATPGLRLNFLLYRAALQGLICQGELRGKQETFVLLEEWLPPVPPLGPQQALAELARRYFTSRGPATLKDFTWWCGLPAAQARAGLELVQDELAQRELNGQVYWQAPTSPAAHPSPSLRLLPAFDEYLIGYSDRNAVLDPQHIKEVYGGNVFNPTIVVDGQVSGTWKRSLRKGTVEVAAQPFAPFSPGEKAAFEAEARDYARFMGLELAAVSF